jgi:hypothetical protein
MPSMQEFKRRLYNPQQANHDIREAWSTIKPWLIAGHQFILTIKPEKRSTDQNAKLHALLKDISEQMEWAGSKRDIETWKRLLTAAWCRVQGEHVEMLPAIDGHGFDIVFRHTSKLTKAECSELIEFIYAWAAEKNIRFTGAFDESH